MLYEVKLDVDGEEYVERVNAPDVKLAINKALKQHPTKVVAVVPLEAQIDLDTEHHPGQSTVDDVGVPDDPGMAAVGDEFAASGLSNADAVVQHSRAAAREDDSGPRQDSERSLQAIADDLPGLDDLDEGGADAGDL